MAGTKTHRRPRRLGPIAAAMRRALALGLSLSLFLSLSIGIGIGLALAAGLGASSARADESGPRPGPELVERHRQLLQQAERDLARGAFDDGLAAAGEALALAEGARDRLRIATARLVRANLSTASGDPDASARDLENVLAEAGRLELPELTLSAWLSLANARIAQGDRAAAARLYDDVQARAAAMIEDGEAHGSVRALAARALANRLRVRVDDGQALAADEWTRARAAVDGLAPSEGRTLLLVHLGESHLRAVEAGLGDRAAQLRAGHDALTAALRQLDEPTAASPVDGEGAEVEGSDAARTRLRAQALGHLGGLYAAQGRLEEALDLTRRALRQAQRGRVEADLFPWHRQAASLHARLGQRDAAIDEYAAAIRVLEQHRAAISRSRLAWMPRVEEATDLSSIYRSYVDLLLRRAASSETEETRRVDLARAQTTLEHLKGDELRDYFEDDCVIRYRERLTSITAASFEAVIVYPFVLEDRLELLVSVGDELFQVVVDVDRDALTEQVVRLRQLLEKRTTRQYLRPAGRLNAWLIEPIQPILDRFAPRTLVFVPDGILRTIPMAALHDGERFLVERYALGLTPGLELTDPKPIVEEDRRALVAGVSDGVHGYEPLPNVEREVDSVHALLGGDKLLNRGFSRSALTDRIREQRFGIVHIASHAEFNATAAGGFLLAHDGRLSFDALAEAVESTRYRERPLELVILSACETAEGDERAALGLSGVAVKAGARSALGTLWGVSDQATAEFMIRFYETLATPGVSRAEAVQAAQVRLISDPRYAHPYYWSPFLLINSWL